MGKLVECIPNFSVSKETNEAVYRGLVDVAKSIPGCMLFDVQSDGNHNRCVFTMVGSPEAIEEAAFQLCRKAMETIDMTKHQGQHPPCGELPPGGQLVPQHGLDGQQHRRRPGGGEGLQEK